MGSNSGAIKAGRAYVEMYVDKDQAKKDLDDTKAEMGAFGSAVSAIGASSAAGVVAVAGAFRRTTEAASSFVSSVGSAVNSTGEALQSWGASISGIGTKILAAGGAIKAVLAGALKTFEEMGTAAQQASVKTGLSVEALSTLGYAARQTGASIDSLEGALGGMRQTIAGLGPEASEGQAALAALGLTLEQLSTLAPDEQFRLIAERLARVEDPAQRAAGAVRIFGSSANGILPLLAKGGSGLGELEAKARSLGLEMSGKDASSAFALHNALSTLWETVKMLTFSIGAPLADATRELVELATAAVASATKWIRENGALIVVASNLSNVLTGVGTAFTVFGGVVSAAGVALTEIVAVAAALASPVAIAAAAVAGLGYYLVTYTEQGQKALQWLSGKFFELRDDALTAFQGISDALQGGDLNAALKVATTLLMLEWTKAIQFLNAKWVEFKFAAIDVAIDLAAGLATAFSDAFAEVQRLWTKTLGALAKAAITFAGSTKLGIQIPGTDALQSAYADAVGASNPKAVAERRKEIEDRARDAREKAAAARERETAAAAIDNVPTAQKDFDDAVAAARAAREGRPAKPDEGPAIAADFSKAALASEAVKTGKTAATGGIGFEDVRSAGGFKAVAAALRQGRDDPQQKANALLGTINGHMDRVERYSKDSRDALNSITGFGFD